MDKIFKSKIDHYQINPIRQAIEGYLEENQQLLKTISGKKILLKPNLLWPASPKTAITTHPTIIEATYQIFKDLNCKIYLGDSPGWRDSKTVLAKLKLLDFINKEKIEILDEEKNKIFEINGKILKKARLFSQLEEIDYIINLPKIKTHMMTGVSLALKNLFGLIIGKDKAVLHFKYPDLKFFYQMLFDIYNFKSPILNIADGIISLEGEGPGKSGNPKQTNYLFISDDGIKLDLYLIKWIKDKKSLFYYLENVPDLKDFYLQIEDLPHLSSPFLLPQKEKKILQLIGIPEKYIRKIREKILPYPATNYDKCSLCQRCLNNCPVKAIRIKGGKIEYNYNLCIKCYCCQEICPEGSIYLKRNLWQKIINRLL